MHHQIRFITPYIFFSLLQSPVFFVVETFEAANKNTPKTTQNHHAQKIPKPPPTTHPYLTNAHAGTEQLLRQFFDLRAARAVRV